MSDNNRKATDVLLSIEKKLEELLSHHRSQELNLKILSNKFNSFLDVIPKMIQESKEKQPPKFTVEVADAVSTPAVKVTPSMGIQKESDPIGFRRTSRPETYEPPADFVEYNPKQKPEATKEMPQQVKVVETSSTIQVTQRVVDKKQKSIFLAEVEIKDPSGEVVHKTRTNSVGKWSGSLKPGKYRVSVSKKESSLKQKVDIFQDIEVTSDRSVNILQDLVVG